MGIFQNNTLSSELRINNNSETANLKTTMLNQTDHDYKKPNEMKINAAGMSIPLRTVANCPYLVDFNNENQSQPAN